MPSIVCFLRQPAVSSLHSTKMFNFVVALLQALLLASSVFAAPVTDGADSVVKRAGPSGTLVQPKDGWGTVWNGGTIS